MDYKHADEFLGAKSDRPLSGRSTRLQRRGENIAVRYHNTDVLTFTPGGDIILNSGGWLTVTTKARMNEYLPRGSYVYQAMSIWYLEHDGQTYIFKDGITIHADGVSGAGELDNQALKKKALKYCKEFIKELYAGDVPAPGPGDCWYCLFRVDGQDETLGEKTHSDHILSHIEEEYFVPSLLTRAIEVFPVSRVAKWSLADVWKGTDRENYWYDDVARKQLHSSLKRYVYRQLGFAS